MSDVLDPSSFPVVPENAFQPLWVTNLGDDAVDLASVCGLDLDDWQQEVVKTSLGYGEDGRFSARQMLLLVPRQQGKNICVEARELAGLFLLHEKIMLHTAQEYRTAVSSYRRLKEWIENAGDILPTPRYRENTTETSIYIPESRFGEKHGSSFLQFTARTPKAGRGLTVELLVVDEAFAYDSSEASALAFTQNQSKNPQSWVTSSTGFPESTELLALRELGLSRELPTLGFFEYKADDGCDPGDRRQWYKALPGLVSGRQRISEIEAHYAKAKINSDFTDFNREVLGLWATVDLPSLITKDLWNSLEYPNCRDEDFEWEAPEEFAFAIDVTPQNHLGEQRASVYAVGQDEFGFHHIWNVGSDDGIMWLPEFLKIQQEHHGPRVTVLDEMSPAAALIPQFVELGVQYTTLRSGQCMAACSQFFAYAIDGKLRHGDDEVLADAVDSGIQRWVGQKGAWLWARKNVDDDISPLVAATYALYALTGVDAAEDEAGGWFW